VLQRPQPGGYLRCAGRAVWCVRACWALSRGSLLMLLRRRCLRVRPLPVSRFYLTACVRQLLLPHRGKPPASSACSSVRSGPNGFAIGQLPGLSGWKVQTCGWRPGVHGLRTSLNHRLRQEHRQNRLPVQCWILGPQRRPMHRVRHREIQGRRRGYRVQSLPRLFVVAGS